MSRHGTIRQCGVALMLMAACTGTTNGHVDGQTDGPIKCEATFLAPNGFEARKPFEEKFPDHIAYRLEYRDDRNRELYYFAGIRGEFGEGLPSVKVLRLTTGERAWLIGKARTWVISWDTGGICGSHAVIGYGFTERGFTAMLRETEVIAPR